MSGRAATKSVIPGRAAISVGDPGKAAPPGWQWTSLYDVAELGTGHTPSRKHPEYWNGDVPWVGIRDASLHHGGTINDTLQHVSELGLENSAARWLPEDTVCLSRTASVGYVFMLGRPMATSQDFVTWSCNEGLDPTFLMKALIAEGDDIRRFGKGSTHTTIYFPEVKAFHICLPPLAEQRRIVAKLDRLSARSTAARDHLSRIPKLAARAKQALLAAAFRGELTEDWRENNGPDKSTETLLDELRVLRRDQWIKSEEDKFRANGKRPNNIKWQARYKAPLPIGEEVQPYEVPKTWCWAVAEEIVAPGAEIVYGIVQPGPQLDDGIPYVRGMDIVDGVIQTSQLLKTSPEIADKYSRAALQGGDVLLGIIRATKVAIVPDEIAGANITQGTARFRPSDAIATKFLARWLEGPVAQGWLHSHYRGIDMPGLNLRDVRRCPIPLPPKNEQAEIVLQVDRALSRISQLTEKVQRAGDLVERLDEQLLAKAFRGDLVPQDPSDEPVKVLLARIPESRAAAPKPKRGRRRKTEASA